MGDHRFTITIKMEFHGKQEEIRDGWFNWDGGRDGIDSRITGLVERVRDEGFAEFDRAMEEHSRTLRSEETERSERAEFERLKAKFEPPKQS